MIAGNCFMKQGGRMYYTILMLHSYTRWLVLAAMLYALVRSWWGVIGKREWTRADSTSAMAYTILISIQFLLGIVLLFLPEGLPQLAWQDFASSIKVRDLRFFGLEHPVQMIIALTVVHLGAARARKANPSAKQFRWAAICFTISAVLILAAIPWWRPLLRGF
jgi:hypothetical protein